MKNQADPARLLTGVPNLDAILHGGLPKSSITVVAGPPGSGKTILTQQICFHNASPKRKVLLFSTLSEPAAKSLKYMKQFSFFDPKKLQDSIRYVDLGEIVRTKRLSTAFALLMKHLKEIKPAIVVIDSFKVFDDLASSSEDLRKFGYEIAVNLMAWEATALLLGEYGAADFDENPFFSIVDGIIVLSQRESLGEQQRFCRIVKMRGTNHSRDEHPFLITPRGVEIFAPRATIKRGALGADLQTRCRTGIDKLDELLGPGIPRGSSLLIGGVAGTGKTVLSLEFIYRGALAGEPGILFSFEETDERLRAAARGLGWDLEREIERGMVQIVFIPQPDIMVEAHLQMIQERILAMKAKRVVIDSVSVLLHKVTDPQVSREKIFQLCSIVQGVQAVGFFPTDIPYGSAQVSRFGVEETVVDGVIILSSTEEGLDRERYLEVYKLRNTAHLKGRHNMVIGPGGVTIFPRYAGQRLPTGHAVSTGADRVGSGVLGLDALLGDGLLRRSTTLVSGSAGIGKTTLGLQFLLEGTREHGTSLYVTLEEGPEQLLAIADSLRLPLRAAVDAGKVKILYVAREHLRAGQFLTVLSDHLRALAARRVVLDAATQLMTKRLALDDFKHIIYNLTVLFKSLDITSLLTLEAPSLRSTGRVSEMGLSPIADNIVMLRYRQTGGRLVPTLTIVKTRGSEHDRGTHAILVGEGGIRIGPSDPLASHAAGRAASAPFAR